MEQKGHSAEIVNLSDLDILDCNGCVRCRNGKGCVLKDDAEALFRKMESSELLVLATPIRFNGPSSILKRLIDRFNPYWYSGRVHPAFACGMMNGGSSHPEFSHARSEMVSGTKTVGMKWLGELCIGDTDFRDSFDDDVGDFALKMLELTEQ